MPADVPLCRNCKHVRQRWQWRLIGDWEFARCAATIDADAEGMRRVTGKVRTQDLGFCKLIRRFDTYECGPAGKLFQPKEETK